MIGGFLSYAYNIKHQTKRDLLHPETKVIRSFAYKSSYLEHSNTV